MLLAEVRDSEETRGLPGLVRAAVADEPCGLPSGRGRPRAPFPHVGRARTLPSFGRPLAGPCARPRPRPPAPGCRALVLVIDGAAWAAASNQRRPCPCRSRNDRVICSSNASIVEAKNKLFFPRHEVLCRIRI